MATYSSLWEEYYLAFIPTNKKWYQFWKPKYRNEWYPYSKWPENINPKFKFLAHL